MKVTVEPGLPRGTVKAPPSKSEAHRLITAAALGKGKSIISSLALSDDIKATLGCVRALGADVRLISSGTAEITGIDPSRAAEVPVLDCGECGTTLRFMIPLCLLTPGKKILTGSERLLSRPLGVYESIFAGKDISFSNDGRQIEIEGRLTAGEYEIAGNVSSQFISGLMFALPLCDGDSVIKIIPPFESRPYADMTADVLRKYGVEIIKKSPLEYFIRGGSEYKSIDSAPSGDWSNAAFFIALKNLGADIEITGLDSGSTQGDRVCGELFEKLAGGFCTADLSDTPDLAPVLFTFAGLCHGAEFTGTDRLRLKESDRIADMARELAKAGIILTGGDNRVTVSGKAHRPDSAFSGCNDHRAVMSLAVLGCVLGAEIEGAQAVNKSYPDFFRELEKTGVKIKYDT